MLYSLLAVVSSKSYGKKTDFPHVLPFIPDFSHHSHAHGALWLVRFTEVTSSSYFSYLSAGRSRLITFIRDQAIKGVSISSPYLTWSGGQHSLPLRWCPYPSPPSGCCQLSLYLTVNCPSFGTTRKGVQCSTLDARLTDMSACYVGTALFEYSAA